METTICASEKQIAAIIAGHDGKTPQKLQLKGTNFVVNLGRAGQFVRVLEVPDIVHECLRYIRDQEMDEQNRAKGYDWEVRKAEIRAKMYAQTADRDNTFGVVIGDNDLPGDNGRFEAYALALVACRCAGNKALESTLGAGPDSWPIREEQRQRVGRRGEYTPTLEKERERCAKELAKIKNTKKGK